MWLTLNDRPNQRHFILHATQTRSTLTQFNAFYSHSFSNLRKVSPTSFWRSSANIFVYHLSYTLPISDRWSSHRDRRPSRKTMIINYTSSFFPPKTLASTLNIHFLFVIRHSIDRLVDDCDRAKLIIHRKKRDNNRHIKNICFAVI